jgi:hypothetical protein
LAQPRALSLPLEVPRKSNLSIHACRTPFQPVERRREIEMGSSALRPRDSSALGGHSRTLAHTTVLVVVLNTGWDIRG